MSNPTGSNWTTNVNRAKTKRWVEAKSYSYDGDDWGDADEYGEYDEPKVSAKPTGLRKATAPVSSQGSAQIPSTERERSNSFGRDDERRAFSGPTSTAYAQPQSSQAPPILYSQEHPPPSQRSQNVPSAANNVRSPMLTSSKAPYDASAGSMISNTSTLISGRRKPSMGQADQSPMVAPISTTIPPPAIGTPDKPSTPTIIRPADIYRRIQEEREKESVSQGSSRPSLSGLTRDESPANKSDNGSGQAQVGMLKDPSRINATPNFASVNSAAPTFADTNLTTPIPFNPSTNILRSKGPSASPKLPEITGLSGFGDDFGSSFMSSTGPVHKTTSASTAKSTGSPIKATEMPSLNVLPSNVDQQQSLQHQSSFGYKTVVNQAFEQAIPPTPSTTSGSGVDRSNSDSTNNISPIISREASSAVRPDGMANISSITEEPAGSSRPGTSGSATKRGSGGPPHQEAAEAATIMPGYRKETGTPGANNTPARTPAIKSNKEIMKPQEAEVAATTPISGDRSPAQRDRSSSPTKSRVRDLVDKIDSAGNSRRGSQASLSEKVDLTSLQRPSVQPKDSFRPSLPGAWASYTTNPNPIPNLELKESTAEPEQPGTNQTPVGEPGEDPFSKAAAAGSALAGALAAAASVAVSAFTSSPSGTTETAVHASKIDTTFHPETARLALPRNDSDTTSSIMPTPSEMRSGIESKSEYFDTMQPLRSAARISPITILATSPGNPAPVTDDLSTKSSPTDLESDKLRKEIVRELSPKRDGLEEVATQEQQPTTTESHVGYSSIYDSYLEEEDGPSRQASEAAKTRTINPTHLDQAKTVSKAEQVAKQSILSSTSDPLENIQESTAASEDPHNLNRQYSWEAPLQDLTLSPNFGSKTEPENGAGAQLSLGTPTAAPRDSVQATVHQRTPSAPLDINKQLPLPATLDNNQIVAPPEPQQRTIHQITKKDSAATVLPLQPTSKSLAFREIMAIQSVPQRIQAFDQTRKTFANTETGLFQWIQATISELPEHEDLLRNGGTFPAVIRPHQTPTVPGSQAMSSNPRPSLGATTGKSAKGKDLFHSAGVLTGKTSNAARGLFAKGKSKWRGSAEKVD